jgi:hypothetical protein
MSPSVIEGLEERRQGKDLSLVIDTTVVLVDGGEPQGPRTQSYYATHPMRISQDQLRIDQHKWATVLERWERGVGIPILVPLVVVEPHADRADVIRHIKSARQKIDGAGYLGSFTEARLALELLRKLSPATVPLPKEPQNRDPLQRIHGVIDALRHFVGAACGKANIVLNKKQASTIDLHIESLRALAQSPSGQREAFLAVAGALTKDDGIQLNPQEWLALRRESREASKLALFRGPVRLSDYNSKPRVEDEDKKPEFLLDTEVIAIYWQLDVSGHPTLEDRQTSDWS